MPNRCHRPELQTFLRRSFWSALLVRARRRAQEAGCDVLLAAPQQQVLPLLALTRVIDVFLVHAGLVEAAGGLVGSPLTGGSAAVLAVT